MDIKYNKYKLKYLNLKNSIKKNQYKTQLGGQFGGEPEFRIVTRPVNGGKYWAVLKETGKPDTWIEGTYHEFYRMSDTAWSTVYYNKLICKDKNSFIRALDGPYYKYDMKTDNVTEPQTPKLRFTSFETGTWYIVSVGRNEFGDLIYKPLIMTGLERDLRNDPWTASFKDIDGKTYQSSEAYVCPNELIPQPPPKPDLPPLPPLPNP